MARRRRDRPLDDIFAIAAKLPWQAGVGLALACFLVLHWYSTPDPVAPTDVGQMGAFAARTFFETLAKIGQFVLPLVFLGGAAASFFAKRKRTQLVEAVATSDASDVLDGLTWREFEDLVEEAFRLRGYTVKRIGGDGPDGGVDLELKRDAETVLVQCKQWRAYKVGVQVVRELYGVMAARGAASGIVVTSGTFTRTRSSSRADETSSSWRAMSSGSSFGRPGTPNRIPSPKPSPPCRHALRRVAVPCAASRW